MTKAAQLFGRPRTGEELQGRSHNKPQLLLIMMIIIVSCAVYVNTLRNGFVYDDIPQVVQNPWIREMRFIPEIFSTNVWAFQGTTTNYYRPLMHISFMLSYYLFGLAPWGFHLVNILLHAGLPSWCFFASRLFRWPSLKLPIPSRRRSAAILSPFTPSIPKSLPGWGVTDLLHPAFLALYFYILFRRDGA
jgi:hypothetical protein